MMTKVRGAKGFDALFSRFFDEPELNAAMGSLHDNFSATDDVHAAETPVAPAAPATARHTPTAAKKQAAAPAAHPPAAKKKVVTPVAEPVATKKQVVTTKKQNAAPLAAEKPSVSHEVPAPKVETVLDEPLQVPSQDLDQEQLADLEVLSSNLTVGWSVDLLEELSDVEIEPTDDQEQELDQLPVIDVYESGIEDAVEVEAQDAVAVDDEAQDAAGDAVEEDDVQEAVGEAVEVQHQQTPQ